MDDFEDEDDDEDDMNGYDEIVKYSEKLKKLLRKKFFLFF